MGYRIGQLAEEVGMSVEGLRYYEREGILPEPRRTPSGYRNYSDAHRDRLRFVKAAQEMGFSLREIKQLLALREGSESACRPVKEQLEDKLEDVRRRLRLLRGFEADLREAVERCDEQLEGGDPDHCPVLADLGDSALG